MTSLPTNQSRPTVTNRVQQPLSEEGSIGSVIALTFVMLLSIAGNIAIIVIFRVFKRVRKQVTNHFLINLAISDLIVALFTMPFWLLYEIDRWQSVIRLIDVKTLENIWTFLDIGEFSTQDGWITIWYRLEETTIRSVESLLSQKRHGSKAYCSKL